MKKTLFLLCLLMAVLSIALAQKGQPGTTQHNIDVPHAPPTQIGGHANVRKLYQCPDANAPLLDVIGTLTDQESVGNEVKFEAENNLASDAIYERRMSIIKAGIDQLRKARTAK